MQYYEELALREKIKAKAKDNFEIVEAELDKEIRELVKKAGVKITEAAIKAEITTHRKRKEAFDDHLEKTYAYNVLNGAVKAFEHKKKALEKLSELYIAGYYSEPKNKNIQDKAYDNLSKKVRKNINK